MGAMSQIVRGNIKMKGELIKHAKAMDAVIGSIPRLFPEGSDFGETDAKEVIWDKWKEFETAAKKAAKASAKYLKAVAGGNKDTIVNEFLSLADTCKGCHKKFRKKKE